MGLVGLDGVVGNWLNQLADQYDQREIKNMFDWALEDVLSITRSDKILLRELSENQSVKIQLILDQLLTGKPYQYCVGVCEFDGLKLAIDERALIPRPETEELVYWISDTLQLKAPVIVDWCTGSGCIALALKNRFPEARVVGIDFYGEAMELATVNSVKTQLKVEWLQSDALGEDRPEILADCIVSNPPYIPLHEAHSMHDHVVKFEPSSALFVPDSDPLLFYRNITEYAIENLKPGGWLFFELHESFAEETCELIIQTGKFDCVEIKQDLQGKSRMLRALKP